MNLQKRGVMGAIAVGLVVGTLNEYDHRILYCHGQTTCIVRSFVNQELVMQQMLSVVLAVGMESTFLPILVLAGGI